MIRGDEKVSTGGAAKYVGCTTVEVRAVNPTRSELNKLLGKEDGDDDKELVYLSEDQEGNKKLRLTFWLYDPKLDKMFPHSINLVQKERVSKDGLKNQYINQSAMTAWADDENNLQAWFTKFTDKDKNELGDKEYRKAILGEEELGTLLRSWLGRMDWYDKETAVLVDTDALFNEDYTELSGLIDSTLDTPFVCTLGVRTDENDTEKQYQQVYGKAFLPASFMTYIQKNNFPTEYAKKAWARYEDDISGAYGFNAYYELGPIQVYKKEKDIAASPTTIGVTPANSKY